MLQKNKMLQVVYPFALGCLFGLSILMLMHLSTDAGTGMQSRSALEWVDRNRGGITVLKFDCPADPGTCFYTHDEQVIMESQAHSKMPTPESPKEMAPAFFSSGRNFAWIDTQQNLHFIGMPVQGILTGFAMPMDEQDIACKSKDAAWVTCKEAPPIVSYRWVLPSYVMTDPDCYRNDSSCLVTVGWGTGASKRRYHRIPYLGMADFDLSVSMPVWIGVTRVKDALASGSMISETYDITAYDRVPVPIDCSGVTGEPLSPQEEAELNTFEKRLDFAQKQEARNEKPNESKTLVVSRPGVVEVCGEKRLVYAIVRSKWFHEAWGSYPATVSYAFRIGEAEIPLPLNEASAP